jgi:hypothetical protein
MINMLGRQKPQSQSKKHNRASLVLPALLLASNIGDGSCFSIINVPKGKTAVAPSLSKSNRSESTQLLNAMSSTESYLNGLSNAVDLVTNVDPAQAAVVSETVKNMFMTTASSEAEALTVETTLDVAKATMEVVPGEESLSNGQSLQIDIAEEASATVNSVDIAPTSVNIATVEGVPAEDSLSSVQSLQIDIAEQASATVNSVDLTPNSVTIAQMTESSEPIVSAATTTTTTNNIDLDLTSQLQGLSYGALTDSSTTTTTTSSMNSFFDTQLSGMSYDSFTSSAFTNNVGNSDEGVKSTFSKIGNFFNNKTPQVMDDAVTTASTSASGGGDDQVATNIFSKMNFFAAKTPSNDVISSSSVDTNVGNVDISDFASSAQSSFESAGSTFTMPSLPSMSSMPSLPTISPQTSSEISARFSDTLTTVGSAASNEVGKISYSAQDLSTNVVQSSKTNIGKVATDVGEKSLSDLGHGVVSGIESLGKLAGQVLNTIATETGTGQKVASYIATTQTSITTMIDDTVLKVTTTMNDIANMTLSQAVAYLIKAIIFVVNILFLVIDSVVKLISGQSTKQWALITADTVNNEVGKLLAATTNTLDDVTHKSLGELTASVGSFSSHVGDVVLSSVGALSDTALTAAAAGDGSQSAAALADQVTSFLF